MKKNLLRRISLSISAVMIVSLLPLSAFAAGGGYEYVISMEHGQIIQYEDADRFVVKDNDKTALYDYSGNRLSASYDNLNYVKEEKCWFASNEGSGKDFEQVTLDNDGKVMGSGSKGFVVTGDRFVAHKGGGVIVLLDIPHGQASEWWKTYTGDAHVYDYSGNLLGSFSYPDHKNVNEANSSYDLVFSDGLFSFRAPDGLCGAINTAGKEVIEPKFNELGGFSNGRAIAAKDGKYGVIDNTGKVIVDFEYDEITMWGSTKSDKTICIIEKNGKWGIMDQDFNVTAEPEFSEFDVYSAFPDDGLIKVWKPADGNYIYGMIFTDGKMLLDCKYYALGDPAEGMIPAAEDYQQWGYFDKSGRQITDFIYEEVAPFSEGMAFVMGEKSGFIDKAGNMAINIDTSDLGIFNVSTVRFSEGLAPLSDMSGNSRYIDKTGKTVIAAKNGEGWVGLSQFHDGLAVVSSSSTRYQGKTGVIRYTNDDWSNQPEVSGNFPSDWAKDEVNAAIAAGIVPVELQKNYSSPISREDFCRLTFEMLKKKGINLEAPDSETPNPFTDTNSNYVYTLNKLGIIDGKGNGIFAPNASITRQEAAKILVNTANILGIERIQMYTEFADKNEAGSWALTFISDAYNIGVMQGVGNGNFSPLGNYTAEQSIITLLRLYNNAGSGQITAQEICGLPLADAGEN